MSGSRKTELAHLAGKAKAPKKKKGKPRGNPLLWKKGQSGNPKGPPKGLKLPEELTARGLRRAALAQGKNMTPLEFLISVMVDKRQLMMYRVKAAHAAAPYVHKKMPIAIEGGDPNKPIFLNTSALAGLTPEEKVVLLTLFEKMQMKTALSPERALTAIVANEQAEQDDNPDNEEDDNVIDVRGERVDA